MLTLDLARFMESREIQNPPLFLKQAGFTHYTAKRLLHNRLATLNYEYLEKLCLVFNCTPNDLLSWRPTASIETKKLALTKLSGRKNDGGKLLTKLSRLPEDKVDEIRKLVDQFTIE